jgi:hypothetical protein
MCRLAHHSGATTTNPYPSEDDLKDLAAVHATLASHGVKSTGADFELSELAAAIYAHNWSYDIDRTGSDYRAIVEQHGSDLGQMRAIGVAWSMEAALAFALEKAFSIAKQRGAMITR